MKTVIHNCTLVDVKGQRLVPDSWVIIENRHIEKVGTGTVPPKILESVEKTLDAKNGFLMPGMINLHVHIQRRHLHLPGKGVFRQGAAVLENSSDMRRMVFAMRNGMYELLNGVTTIRDCCSKGRLNNEYRNCVREELVMGPRVLSCGLGIASTGGHETHRYPGAVQVDGPAEVMKAVREEIKQGADFVKFMGSGGIGGLPEHEHPYWVELTEEELRAGITEAHNRMKTCTVHAMGKKAVEFSVKAGMDGIEHGTNLDEELVSLMKTNNVYYVPTMSGIAAVAQREHDAGSKELSSFIRKLVVDPQFESVSLAHRKGLLIGAGTDTLGDMVRELEMFTECGMSAMEALRTATCNAAEILNKQDEIGDIAPAMVADLLLLSDNPAQSVSNLRGITWVMREGKIVNPESALNP